MTDHLPLLCRLRRHGWRPRAFWPGWERTTCNRCHDLRISNPPEGSH